MKKKIYSPPRTEVMTYQVKASLLKASKITYRDPNTGETHTQEIEENDDPDFEAGAKKHDFSYNAWDYKW